MKLVSAFLVVTLGLILAGPASSFARPEVTIIKPVAGATVLLANRPFKVAGTAGSPSGITSILVQVAGQTLSPLGTNHWKVLVNVGVPGRYSLKVIAKAGDGTTTVRKRVINVRPQ